MSRCSVHHQVLFVKCRIFVDLGTGKQRRHIVWTQSHSQIDGLLGNYSCSTVGHTWSVIKFSNNYHVVKLNMLLYRATEFNGLVFSGIRNLSSYFLDNSFIWCLCCLHFQSVTTPSQGGAMHTEHITWITLKGSSFDPVIFSDLAGHLTSQHPG